MKANTSSGDDFSIESGATFIAGSEATLEGYSTAAKTDLTLQMLATTDREIVGTLKNLKVNGDISVIGEVIGCTLYDSASNIRQFHHTIDTQQLLDADSPGDKDLKQTSPSLDNALQLQTGG
jgi:hypothetical protein